MTDRILERLQDDHKQLYSLLQVLERQLQSISRHDRPDYELMYQILHYLTHYPDRYHHVLEHLLFERLVGRCPDMKSVYTVLHDQHARLTCMGAELCCSMNNILNGVIISRSELLNSGWDYLLEYHGHLDFEEKQVFPQLVAKLTMSDWITLTTTFVWKTDPLIADSVNSEYRLLTQRLQLMGVYNGSILNDGYQNCAACSDESLRQE